MSAVKPLVLIAEDNPATAGILEFALSQSGLNTQIARNGKLAIKAVGEKRFDAIITDYQMPGANGKEVIEATRSEGPNTETSIILCSAKGLELDTVEITNQFALSHVLYKPFSPNEIVKTVWELPTIKELAAATT